MLHGAAMGEGQREQRSDMHGRDAVMAGSEKQGGESKRSVAETHRLAEFNNQYPRLWKQRLFSEGPAFARRANAHPSEHTPCLPRKTVSYNANEKPRLKQICSTTFKGALQPPSFDQIVT